MRALDVAQRAHAVLQVGFLEVRAPTGLLATLALRLDDGLGERLPRLPAQQLGQPDLQLGELRTLAAEEPGLEQRDMQVKVVAGIVGGFRHRPDGLTDLETDIPQRVKNRFHRLLGLRRVRRHQDEEVDVAQRAKFGAAIAARRHQREAGGGRAGAEVEGIDDDIDRIGTELGDFVARNARTMRRQLNLPGFLEEGLGPWHHRSLLGRLPGQTVLEGGAPETNGGRFEFGRHR